MQQESPMKEQAVRIEKRTSRGVLVAVDSNVGAVVGAEERAIGSIPGNEGGIAQAWVNVRGGPRVFSVYFWAQNEVSTCRSKSPKGEPVEKSFDFVIACDSFRRKISQMDVVKDFESRPHKAVSFVVAREKETQEWNDQKLLKVLPGYRRGRLPGMSTKKQAKKGRDGQRNIKDEIAQKVVASRKVRKCQVDFAQGLLGNMSSKAGSVCRLEMKGCCNCSVLNLVSTRFCVFCFSFGSLSLCCCHGVPCW